MSAPKVCVHLVFALALARMIGFGAVQAADKPGDAVEARQWEVVDVPFAVQEKPEAPFAIDATATVEGPGGKKLTVPLFYNGGREFVLRFTPPTEGDWAFAGEYLACTRDEIESRGLAMAHSPSPVVGYYDSSAVTLGDLKAQ